LLHDIGKAKRGQATSNPQGISLSTVCLDHNPHIVHLNNTKQVLSGPALDNYYKIANANTANLSVYACLNTLKTVHIVS
jgi:hypothetical protein